MIDSLLQGIEGLSLPFQPAATGSMSQLLKLAGEFVDLGGDVSTQQLESGDCCQSDERCGNGVL